MLLLFLIRVLVDKCPRELDLTLKIMENHQNKVSNESAANVSKPNMNTKACDTFDPLPVLNFRSVFSNYTFSFPFT